ncbi:MAG: NTP transferase domain-containing protein [Deltaproteobacteria bacterium]|nr:NTP transferase domain-containing protein [Deltaproteobacteria bacterium]
MSIRQVVILAAGQGTRLRKDDRELPKPLYPLLGRPLISYVMEAFAEVGVRDFFVVVGFHKEELIPGLEESLPAGCSLHLVDNPDWAKSNGVSLHKAKGKVEGRFFLSMSDHLFQADMIHRLQSGAAESDTLYLAVDRKLDQVFDMDDATKVRTQAGRITAIDKKLTDFDAVDTGLFICPPGVFSALESVMEDGDCSLSDGVRELGRAGKARVVDIGPALWQDVDTPDMLGNAESLLRERWEPGAGS